MYLIQEVRVYVEKDSEEGHGVRVRESQVGMVTLDGMDEVSDVESPRRGERRPPSVKTLKTWT